MLNNRPIHPLLLAVYPIAALLAVNIEWLRPEEALRSALLSLAAVALLYLALRRALADRHRAALLVSLLVFAFFSYGHLYEALKAMGQGAGLGRHRYLSPLFLLSVAGLAWWILRRARAPEAATGVLNLVAAAALIFPLFQLGRWTLVSLTSPPAATEPAATLRLPEGRRAPDIYYIIVDAYARQDTLRRVYEYDNSGFIEFLRSRGFYVADDSRSNYAQTGLSLASSLNMNYLEQLLPGLEEKTRGRESVWNLIRRNQVRRQLESLGYLTVGFSTGLAGTEWADADLYYSAGAVDEHLGLAGVNPFEGLVIQTSLLRLVSDGVVALPRLVPDVRYPYQVHRTRVRNILDHLGDLPPTDRPKFVFAHIISPHPPFVFDADGNPVTPDTPFSLRFTFDAGDPSREDYLSGYRGQVVFINRELERVIDSILANAPVPPVILIQGDHGPDSGSGRVSYVQERMTNLDALLIPGGSDRFRPGLTPVNSFRIVFDEVFGADYRLLDDRVLYSEYDTPYRFNDVTEAVTGP